MEKDQKGLIGHERIGRDHRKDRPHTRIGGHSLESHDGEDQWEDPLRVTWRRSDGPRR